MQEFLRNIDNQNDLLLVLNFSIDFLITFPKSQTLKEIIQKNTKLKKLPENELIHTTSYLANLCKQYVAKGITQNEMKLHLSNLNEEFHGAVFNQIKLREQEIAKCLIAEFNSKDDQLLLDSFDWELNWILGSSSLANLREQLATFTLNCRNKDDIKTISIEMNHEKITKLIETLENSIKTENKE